MVPLLHMMLNCVFGGKGVGLMNMIMYVMLGVFLCGLMIGRTPEYLGKKVEGREMKMAVLVLIIHPPADPGLLRPGRRYRGRPRRYHQPRLPRPEPGTVRVLFFRRQQRLWL